MADKKATLPATRPKLAAGSAVQAIIPTNIEQAHRLAVAIREADMAPKSYDRNENRIMVGIMHGMEVGLPPMAALQSIAVINGMPCIWGDGALGLVLGSGLVEDMSETTEGKGDDETAVCIFKRKDRKTPIEGRFSIGDAKKAKLWGKAGPWTNYPARMLKMRARAFAMRDGFADVLRGIRIAEEIADYPTLKADANGVYTPDPPRPSHTEPQDSDEVFTRAMDIADRDGISTDDALALAREEPRESEDTDAAVDPKLDAFGLAPVDAPAMDVPKIEMMKLENGLPDYKQFGDDMITVISSAPDLAWLDELLERHEKMLVKVFKMYPEAQAKFDKHVEARRKTLRAVKDEGSD